MKYGLADILGVVGDISRDKGKLPNPIIFETLGKKKIEAQQNKKQHNIIISLRYPYNFKFANILNFWP